MIQEDRLRQIVACLLKIAPENLTTATELNSSLSGSIGRARLDAALRTEFGVSKGEVYTLTTYGQLANLLCEDKSKDPGFQERNAAYATTAVPAGEQQSHGVGIDIEAIRNLPKVSDYWESDFYNSHFTKHEIGYCMLRSDPAGSFAGLWSAKEALKKTSSKWVQLDWREIEIAHTAEGSPYLVAQGIDLRPEYSLSISHVAEFAVGVVVRIRPFERVHQVKISPPTDASTRKSRSFVVPVTSALFVLSLVLFCLSWYLIEVHR